MNLLERFGMKNGKLVTYWDACIHITILEKDKKDLDLYNGSIYAKECVEKKEHFLVLSQMIKLEITQTTISEKANKVFVEVLKRSNVMQISMGNRVTNLSGDLIRFCNGIGRKLKSPDSIHLATALIYEVDEFYTNDTGLLGLNGLLTIPKYNALRISRPPLPKQMKLELK